MNTRPRFSILVPTYNQASYLPQALDSLLAQSVGDFEAIVVDDGSTDGTAEVLAGYAARDGRIRPLRRANGGCAAALNTALAQARGQWVGWLSSDDLFEPDKLAVHEAAIAQRPDIAFFHTHFRYLDEATGEISEPDTWRPIPPPQFQVTRFLAGNYVHGNAVMIRKDVLDQAGFFDEGLRCAQDFDMWLRLSLGWRSEFLPQRTCVTRWHSGQTTNQFPVAGLYDSCRSCLRLLNTRAMEELFPLMDLRNPQDAAAAAGEVLDIACSTASYLYQLGYHSLLFDRLAQWLAMAEPASAEAVRALVGQALRDKGPALPPVLGRALAGVPGPFGGFVPLSASALMASTLADPATPTC